MISVYLQPFSVCHSICLIHKTVCVCDKPERSAEVRSSDFSCAQIFKTPFKRKAIHSLQGKRESTLLSALNELGETGYHRNFENDSVRVTTNELGPTLRLVYRTLLNAIALPLLKVFRAFQWSFLSPTLK